MENEELIKYIHENNYEFQALALLLFNKNGIYIAPLKMPHIIQNGENYVLAGANNNDIVGSTYVYSFYLMESYSSELFRMVNHAEHLYAYEMRIGNTVSGEYIYDKSSRGGTRLFDDMVLEYLQIAKLDSAEHLIRLLNDAVKDLQSYQGNNFNFSFMYTDLSIVFDEKFMISLNNSGIDQRRGLLLLKQRLAEVEFQIFYNDRNLISQYQVYFCENHGKIDTLCFLADYVPKKELKTNIKQDVSILNDSIPQILYNLSLELKANIFYVATGFMYDKGIKYLEPVINAVQCAHGKCEILVGALQNYSGSRKKMKQINRVTAKKINELIMMKKIDGVYSHSKSFFHGKFYYIANDEEAYVIMGSSNVTQSAFYNNNELDVIYRFNHKDKVCSLEQQFLDWYRELISNSELIEELDLDRFESNTYLDEYGKSTASSILKQLTDDELKKRFSFLNGFNPTIIEELPFKNRKDLYRFKTYNAFMYEEYNMTIFESIKSGNACYVFSTANLKDIKDSMANKSKDEVKKSSHLISVIEHYEDFDEAISGIFNNRK